MARNEGQITSTMVSSTKRKTGMTCALPALLRLKNADGLVIYAYMRDDLDDTLTGVALSLNQGNPREILSVYDDWAAHLFEEMMPGESVTITFTQQGSKP